VRVYRRSYAVGITTRSNFRVARAWTAAPHIPTRRTALVRAPIARSRGGTPLAGLWRWESTHEASSQGGQNMRAIATLVGVTLMAAIPIAGAMAQQPGSPPAPQQTLLVGSDSLVGSAVRDTDGRDIGKVSRLMIDPAEGRISSVIIATGGTLGVGANTISIP